MSSENSGHVLNTIKGHGLAVGDRVHFHGMGSDPLPTVEGTRVEIGKVGAKYMLTTVTGEVMTWEFGASAKVWISTDVAHDVTTEARTLDNGDTVYVGQCEHGWMTGFHVTEADARDVATGHGEVSRPLYVADIIAGTDKTLIPPVDVFAEAMAEAEADEDPEGTAVESAMGQIKTTGRVFVAEAHNFGGRAPFDTLVRTGWATLVNAGPMSRWVRTRYTADRKRITDGLAVWDYNLNVGRVVLSTIDGEGWFNVVDDNGDCSLMNGERVRTAHPSTGEAASMYLVEDTAPLDIPAPGEAEVMMAEHDAAMNTWAEPLVKALTIPAEVTEEAWTGAGVVVSRSGRTLWTETRNGVTRVKGINGRHTEWDGEQFAELIDLGVLSVPTVTLRGPIRTLMGRRKRKATKVNARRVRGGF